MVAAFDNDADGQKLTQKLSGAITNVTALTPTADKDWNAQLLRTRQELRDWYKQARDIGRSEDHLGEIEAIGKAFTQDGTPPTKQDRAVMIQDQTDWQRQTQTVVDCAHQILDAVGEPEVGGTVFMGKTYNLFAQNDSLYALASERGVEPTEADSAVLPDSVLETRRGIILKAEEGVISIGSTSITNSDAQRFEHQRDRVVQNLRIQGKDDCQPAM